MPSQGVTNVANAIINKINNLISSHNSNENAHQDIRNNIPSASSATPSADTQDGSVGTGTTWARSDHTHPKSSLYAESTHTHEGYIQNQEFYFDGDDFVVISDEQTITKTLTIIWDDNNDASKLRPRYLQVPIGNIIAYLSEESDWSVSIPVDSESFDLWEIPSVPEYMGTMEEVDDTTTMFTYKVRSFIVSPSDSPGSDEELDPYPIKVDGDE